MTQTIQLNNIGLKGLSTDQNPWALPPEFITAGRNFRVFAGAITTGKGIALWDTAPTPFNPGYLFHVGSVSGAFWMMLGRSAAYVFDGATWSDISSTAGYAGLSANDELLWSSCLLGQIPIVNNPQAAPEYWSPISAGQILQPLPFDSVDDWATLGYAAKAIRSHKSFLFALNLKEGVTEFPDSYRWSHPADINGLPVTWDETDDAFLAGKASLGGDGGRIIDGLSMRDSFCIYSEKGIDILDSTNDEFVWRRRELSSTVGLVSKESVVEIKGAHYLITGGDIVRNDGNKITSIIHNRLKSDFSSRIDVDNYQRSYAVRNNNEKEIWFCIPEVGSSYANIAYIYNWKDDSWAIKDIPANIAFSNQGAFSAVVEAWNVALDTWDVRTGIWNSSGTSPINDTVVGVDVTTDTLYFLDPNQTSDNDLDFEIERVGLVLLDDKQVTTITRVYPHMLSEGAVSIEFGSQDYPNAPVRWKPAVIFEPSVDRKIDVRTTGEYHAWRIKSIGKAAISMSGMTIEFARAGVR